MKKKLSDFETQTLRNQIAIMAGLKEHLRLTHGYERTGTPTQRFEEAIELSIVLLTGLGE